MECREVQDNLNNYIEAILPSEALKLFEEHLVSCDKCSESLADLKKTIAHIKDLEEIEPPLWLTQKVMAKVREEAEVQQKKGILRRLSSFFKINMPLKAVAAVAIAVTTIYIFRDIQPVVQTIKPAIDETTEQKPLKEQKKTRIPKKEKMVQEPATVGKVEIKESSLPYAGSPMSAAGYGSADKFSKVQEAPAPALEQDRTSSYAFTPSPASPAKNDTRDEVRLEAKAAPSLKAEEETKSYDIFLTVNVKDLAPAKKAIWKILSQSGGKVTKTESYKDRYVFSAELNTTRLKELNEKLRDIGEVKQKDFDSMKTQGNLSVKIEIVGM